MPNLSNYTLINTVRSATTAAGSTPLESSIIDMAGYEGVLIAARFGTAAADNILSAKMSTANDSATMSPIAGSAVAVGGTSDENQWLDIYRPKMRYVQALATRATSSKLGEIWAIQYGGRKLPEDNNTVGTIAGELSVSQSTGTA